MRISAENTFEKAIAACIQHHSFFTRPNPGMKMNIMKAPGTPW